MTTDQVYVQREGSFEEILFKEPSFLDDSPALTTLRGIINDRDIARSFTVGAVDANTGDFIAMNNENTPLENLA